VSSNVMSYLNLLYLTSCLIAVTASSPSSFKVCHFTVFTQYSEVSAM